MHIVIRICDYASGDENLLARAFGNEGDTCWIQRKLPDHCLKWLMYNPDACPECLWNSR